jgi:polyisoprenoid-binding protein YceI
VVPDQSEITWHGHKEVGDSHTGTVKVASGSVTVAGSEVTDAQIVIDMTSIANTDVKDAGYNKKLVDHLGSEDFFKTAEFKTAEFKMDTTKKSKIEKGEAKIAGKLTIRGKTQDYTVNLTGIKTAADKAEASGKIKFDRTKFDVKYNSASFPNLFKVAKDKVIKNDVDLDFKIAAAKK